MKRDRKRPDRPAQRQARAAIAPVRLGHADEVGPLLRHLADPRLRSFIVNWLNPWEADPKRMAAELVEEPRWPVPGGGGDLPSPCSGSEQG
jgi:hypothetical protein